MSRQEISGLHFEARITYWKTALNAANSKGRKTYCQKQLSDATKDLTEFQSLREHFLEHGEGITLKSWKHWGVIDRDQARPSFFRLQTFNRTGVVAHYVNRSADAVLLEAFHAGFRVIASRDTLLRMSRASAWNPFQISYAMPSASM